MNKSKNKSRKRLFFVIFGQNKKQQFGTLLMILALTFAFYVYYPLVQLFLPVDVASINSDSKIIIPKIKIVSPIIWDINPFNKEEYSQILTEGVAHAKGTSYPAQDGTMYIFAHSSDFPWRLTRYNVIFFRLGELVKGDKIIINKEGRNYEYRVRELKNVWPNEVEYLTKATRSQLILQTCTPPGTAFMRLLVFADPVY